MPHLEISLLGSPQLKLDGKIIDSLSRHKKALALLVYLVVTKQQYAREFLAELLWSDEKQSVEQKRGNLRGKGALLELKPVLGEFLADQRNSLAFRIESDYWLDVDEFEHCLRQPNPTLEQLQTAVRLYRNDFFTGFSFRDADGFEDWVQVNRERLRRLALNAHYLLAVHYKQARQYPAGLESITRLLALEPYFEEAHREMMLLLALTGQVSAAAAHYERYWDALDAEGLEPEAETKALYQKLLRGEIVADTAVPPPITTAPPPTWTPPFQTPPTVRHFVGRQELLAQMVADLQKPDGVMVHALAGMGGVGKSTLAKEIAHAAQEYFADGVLWASVAVSEPTAVLESWAQAYGYDFSRLPDVESMATAFRGALAEKRVLLVLDDVTSAARIRPLLPNGPNCRVLLTTRDQDLAYALDAKVWPLNELSPENGRLLLAHILGEERVQAEPYAATAICTVLQNLPLAVEIIGQRLKSRPQRQLADIVPRLLDEKLRLSELQISDREVRASFAVSYATLDSDLRQMFGLMGVFHGRSFTADALSALAVQDRYETEDRIFALTALSLAQADGPTRYRQHPLLADFAREKLEGGNVGEVYGRFSYHYLAFAQQHPHDYDALRPEWDNLMAAMQAAHDHQLWQIVIDFANALHDAWFARGRYTQARQGYRNACIAANQLGKRDHWAQLKLNWGHACIEQSDFDQAADHLADARAFFATTNDENGIANVLSELARIALDKNHYEEAMAYLAEARTIREQQGDEAGIATILFRSARIYYETNELHKAEELATQAWQIQQRHDQKRGMIATLRLLAQISLVRKAYDEAQQYCQQALDLSDTLGDQGELAAALYGLTGIYRHWGEKEAAQNYGERALLLFQQMGLLRYEAMVLYELGEIFRSRGLTEKALALIEKSINLYRQVGDDLLCTYALLSKGDIYQQMNNREMSQLAWHEALRISERLNHPYAIKLTEQRLSQLAQ